MTDRDDHTVTVIISSQEEYQFNIREFQIFVAGMMEHSRNHWYEENHPHCSCKGGYREIEFWFMYVRGPNVSAFTLETTDMILADWREIDRIRYHPQMYKIEEIYDIFLLAHLGEELHRVREYFEQDDGVLQDELIELCQPHLLERWGTPCQYHMIYAGFRENNGRIIFNRELFDRRRED
jgi:hypothetical protein